MRKTGFLKADGFLGLAVSLLVLLATGSAGMRSLESTVFDLGRTLLPRVPLADIAVIAIDESSLARLGPWPWPREPLARITEQVAQGGAKTIAHTTFFEPPHDTGYALLDRLQAIRRQTEAPVPEKGGDLAAPAYAAASASAPAPRVGVALPEATMPEVSALPLPADFSAVLDEAAVVLDADRRFAARLTQAGNVILPLRVAPGARPFSVLPTHVARHRLTQVGGSPAAADALPEAALVPPVAELASAAAGLGALNSGWGEGRPMRSEALLVRHEAQFFPALAVLVAAHSQGLATADIQVRLGQEVRLGTRRIFADGAMRIHPCTYAERDGRPPFRVDSFADVASGKVAMTEYRDKIVLIGLTAVGVDPAQAVSTVREMPPVLALANAVSSHLQGHGVFTPAWGRWVSSAVFGLLALYLVLLLPRLTAGRALVVSGALFAALLSAQLALLLGAGLWLPWVSGMVLLLVGHALLPCQRLLVTGSGGVAAVENDALNRRMGRAFQGQGQLEWAFDAFRKCPLDAALMAELYALGLDFERQRLFQQAERVFRYMAGFDPEFRDLKQRLQRAQPPPESETEPVPALASRSGDGEAPAVEGLAGGEAKGAGSTLGGYVLEKAIGKGAMGVVYLGRDVRRQRVAAIKTLALAQEFDGDELADVKARFFREVETAGRLHHPNIVTMYDAGEEGDLAYVAMEYLKGSDLVPYTRPGQLLPLPTVLEIGASIAEALAYAHANHVVHRDVKPANVMYDPESGALKVTDFGIARITDASRTRTGMVLGTPSYMSPEQLSGQKVDGRSDLFSLGVMLYQLFSGKLPFVGESMAKLMFKIANDVPVDVRSLNPLLPPEVAAVIERALSKSTALRYPNGEEMARDLRACLSQMRARANLPGAQETQKEGP